MWTHSLVLVTVAPPEPGPAGEPPHEALLAILCRERWRDTRPAWVDPGWWSMPMRSAAAQLLRLRAGPELLVALNRFPLTQTCPARHEGERRGTLPAPGSAPGFACGCLLVLAAAWAAVAAWASVNASAAVAGAAGREPVVLPAQGSRPRVEDPAREDIAIALRQSPSAAAAIIADARNLVAHPEAWGLAAEGVVPLSIVRRVCNDVALLDPADARAVIDVWGQRVRDRARSTRGPMTAQGARRCANRLIIKAPSHQRARARARAGRRVELLSNTNGTSTLSAVLKEEDALRVHRRLTAMARGLDDPADSRCMDARRADLLVDILLGGIATQASGVEVSVVIPLAGLLGLTEEPAEIPGAGPLPIDVARTLAADARWRAWLTDDAGRVVATTQTTYRPSAALARLIRAREPSCRMPGCTTPSARCDLDHAVPYPTGPTSPGNLGPLCRRHHVMKTHMGYHLVPEREVWRTPAGAEVSYAPSAAGEVSEG